MASVDFFISDNEIALTYCVCMIRAYAKKVEQICRQVAVTLTIISYYFQVENWPAPFNLFDRTLYNLQLGSFHIALDKGDPTLNPLGFYEDVQGCTVHTCDISGILGPTSDMCQASQVFPADVFPGQCYRPL